MAESGLKRVAESGRKRLMPKRRKMNGRPRSERLTKGDVAYLRGLIRQLNTSGTYSDSSFYADVFKEACSQKFHDFPQPSDIESVSSAFKHAFSSKRPLPELYWRVVEELLGISRSDLPSRKKECDDNRENTRTIPNNLPRPERAVVGREAEISKLLKVLAEANSFFIVSITGPAGVGKTALALEVAYRCLNKKSLPSECEKHQFDFDAIVWTSAKEKEIDGPTLRPRLSVKSDLASIVQEILKVTAPETSGALPNEERQREIALDLLRKKRVLLVVDNLEAIQDGQVSAFIKDVPAPSKVIVTDRRAIHESYSFALPELPLTDAVRMVREQCNSELLRDRVVLTNSQAEELATKTGGIPLAIIWTIGRIAATDADPQTVIRRLSDVGSSPVLGFLFTESYEQIGGDSKKILAALAACGAAVRGDMLADWLGLTNQCTEDSLDQLKQFALVTECQPSSNAKSLVNIPILHRSYRLLPLTRNFVKCSGPPSDHSFREIVTERMIRFVSRDEQNPDWPSIETIDLIDRHNELLAWCVESSFADGRHEAVLQMIRVISYALGIRGYNDQRLRLAEMAINSARAINNPSEWARALLMNKAWVYFVWGDHTNSELAVKEGLDLARGANEPELEAIGLRLMGQIAKERKDYPTAEKLVAEALAMFEKAKDPYQIAITRGTWGSLKRDLREYKEAEKNMREALRIARMLKNAEELVSINCQKLTKLMIELGRLPEAEEFNSQAEAILTHLRRQVGVAYCKLNKARLAERRGAYAESLAFAIEAEDLFVRFGDKQEIADDLKRIQLLARQGMHKQNQS